MQSLHLEFGALAQVLAASPPARTGRLDLAPDIARGLLAARLRLRPAVTNWGQAPISSPATVPAATCGRWWRMLLLFVRRLRTGVD